MYNSRDVAVIGGGGHAKVIIDTLLLNKYNVIGIYDDDHTKLGKAIYRDVKVIGSTNDINDNIPNFICAIGNNTVRKTIVEKLKHINWISTLVHPSAVISETAIINRGTFINAGVIIQSDVVIGEHTIINTGASIDHDTNIGNFCHICPRVTLCGGVLVQNNVFIGAGSVIIHNNLVIGENSVVGAGSVVLKNVDSNITIVGNPARKIR